MNESQVQKWLDQGIKGGDSIGVAGFSIEHFLECIETGGIISEEAEPWDILFNPYYAKLHLVSYLKGVDPRRRPSMDTQIKINLKDQARYNTFVRYCSDNGIFLTDNQFTDLYYDKLDNTKAPSQFVDDSMFDKTAAEIGRNNIEGILINALKRRGVQVAFKSTIGEVGIMIPHISDEDQEGYIMKKRGRHGSGFGSKLDFSYIYGIKVYTAAERDQLLKAFK